MSTSTPSASAPRLEASVVFLVTMAALLGYALRGGTYDVVARGEAGIVVWWIVLIGLALSVFPRSRPTVPAWVLITGFVSLTVWTLASFSWTESDERTSVELARTVHHLGVLVLVFCVLQRRTVSAAIAGAGAAAGLLAALGVASRLWPDAFPADLVRANFGGARLSYPFNYWNAVAACGAMSAAMALAWSAHARSGAWRAMALATVPVAVTAVYLTYSRAGAAGLAIGAVLVFAASRTRGVVLLHLMAAAVASFLVIHAVRGAEGIARATGTGGRGGVLFALAAGMAICAGTAALLNRLEADRRLVMSRRAAAAITAVGVCVIAIGTVLLLPVIRKGLDEFRGNAIVRANPSDPASRLTDLSGNRANVWRSALDAFSAGETHGTGPGTFEFWWSRQGIDPESVRDAHSLYLEALAEMGWPGLLCVLLICGGALAALVTMRVRAASRSEAGAGVAALVAFSLWLFHAGVDWMWEETAVTVFAIALAACACAGISAPRGAVRVPLRVPLVALCAIAMLVQFPPLVGTSRVRDSQRAAAGGRLEAAQASAQDAVDAWPWAATPLIQRALVAEAIGRPEIGEVDARRAEQREPTNWRHPLLISRLEAERGHTTGALRYFRRARALRPQSAIFNPPRVQP